MIKCPPFGGSGIQHSGVNRINESNRSCGQLMGTSGFHLAHDCPWYGGSLKPRALQGNLIRHMSYGPALIAQGLWDRKCLHAMWIQIPSGWPLDFWIPDFQAAASMAPWNTYNGNRFDSVATAPSQHDTTPILNTPETQAVGSFKFRRVRQAKARCSTFTIFRAF